MTQRVMAVALGYEDLNDHDTLRRDPLVAAAVGKADPTGENRVRPADRGAALAGKSTLNRLELVGSKGAEADRYKKVTYDEAALDALLVDVFVESHPTPPARIVLDVDATDDPLHGQQEGRFFHGYYRHYCYLPLYIFCGAHMLCARLRPSNIDGAAGAVDELARIVERVRQAWPSVSIVVRGDSGFCRDELLNWCEVHAVEYVIGLAKNERLTKHIAPELAQAQAQCQETGVAARVFADFRYRTRKSWSRERRVVGKAEHLPAGANPRFVVTSLPPAILGAQALYEDFYCARGDMENRIKEQQLALFADRTSSSTLRANQLRLYWATLPTSCCQLRLSWSSGKGTGVRRYLCRQRPLGVFRWYSRACRQAVLSWGRRRCTSDFYCATGDGWRTEHQGTTNWRCFAAPDEQFALRAQPSLRLYWRVTLATSCSNSATGGWLVPGSPAPNATHYGCGCSKSAPTSASPRAASGWRCPSWRPTPTCSSRPRSVCAQRPARPDDRSTRRRQTVRDYTGAPGPFGRGVLTRPILAPRARRRPCPDHRWRLSWPSRTPTRRLMPDLGGL